MHAVKTQNKLNVRDACLIAVFTALTAIAAQIVIPMPLGVPITLQTMVIALSGVVLGARRAFWAALVYILLGAVGAPVFTTFQGGIHMVFGRTGGFILTFPIMALVIGLLSVRGGKWTALGLICGIAINYVGGILMFMFITKSGFIAAATVCVLPFLPTDVIKAALAWSIGAQLKKRLRLKASTD